MKKTLLKMITGLVALSSFSLQARTLTPEQALERVQSGSSMRINSKSKPQLVYTATADNSPQAGAYVFSTGSQGFMVLSADDEAPAVLGYSDKTAVNQEDMPPAFRYWLEQYASQIEAARNYGVRKSAAKHTPHAAIEPMVKTRWNQNAPYNDMAPEVNGSRSVTGCVATALAQIMNYHQWPAKGQGSNSYEWTSQNKTLSLDFSTVTFDWANMMDEYSSASTTAEKEAVAQLMYACGIAVNMQYSPQSSGTQSYLVANAMYKFFNYDKGIVVLNRDFYNLYDWEDLVYDQLENYGPVQYSGVSSEGGHSFVCDGYSSDGYFHINWGWGGMSDGYFLLTALDPETQGIGGSSSGYNSYQDIVANVGRPKSNTSFASLMSMNSFNLKASNASLGSSVTVTGFTYNGAIQTIAAGTLGMKAVSESGAVTYMQGTEFTQLPSYEGYNSWTFTIPSSLAEGSYMISPVFKNGSGDWKDVQVPITGATYYIMSVANGVATLTKPEPVTLTATNVDITSDIYAGVACRITASLSNEFENDFYGYIAPGLISGSEVYALGTSTMVNVPGGSSTELDYMGSFTQTQSKGDIAAGQYGLAFFDLNTGEAISEPVTVNVNAKPTTTSAQVTGLTLNTNNIITDLADVTFSGNFRVTEGAFGGSFIVFIFPENGGNSIDYVYSKPVFAGTGQSEEFSFKGALSAVESGKKYIAAAFSGNTQLSAGTTFSVDLSSGITDPQTLPEGMYPSMTDGVTTFSGETPALIRVYSTGGALMAEVQNSESVDLAPLPSGVYFIEITQQDNTSRIINRVIRR